MDGYLMALTDAERVFVEALRTVRAKLMDTITGLDDTIAEVAQAADARNPTGKSLRQQRLETLGEIIRDLPDGGVQVRQHTSGTILNVAADGVISVPVWDIPQA